MSSVPGQMEFRDIEDYTCYPSNSDKSPNGGEARLGLDKEDEMKGEEEGGEKVGMVRSIETLLYKCSRIALLCLSCDVTEEIS
ncbi:hypothetical protein Tco_0167500 [Tanacetum coccineum]